MTIIYATLVEKLELIFMKTTLLIHESKTYGKQLHQYKIAKLLK